MGRRKKGIPIHGWLIIDKPLELSSNSVVGKARWLTKAQKVGHGGTLDPLASGILPLAFGEATKTVSFVMDGTKTYQFEITFGEARSTDDAEGEVVATSELRPTADDIRTVLPEFLGDIQQVPPKYSAIKIDGQRAYKLAREDQDIEMQARTVRIDSLKLLQCPDSNRAVFEVECGKGTYVRSLGRDIAQKLGTVGYISLLRRTKVGPFGEKDAISLDQLEDIVHSAALSENLLAIETVLDDILALALTQEEGAKIRNGMAIKTDLADADTVRLMCDDQIIALARIADGRVLPFRVFNF